MRPAAPRAPHHDHRPGPRRRSSPAVAATPDTRHRTPLRRHLSPPGGGAWGRPAGPGPAGTPALAGSSRPFPAASSLRGAGPPGAVGRRGRGRRGPSTSPPAPPVVQARPGRPHLRPPGLIPPRVSRGPRQVPAGRRASWQVGPRQAGGTFSAARAELLLRRRWSSLFFCFFPFC